MPEELYEIVDGDDSGNFCIGEKFNELLVSEGLEDVGYVSSLRLWQAVCLFLMIKKNQPVINE